MKGVWIPLLLILALTIQGCAKPKSSTDAPKDPVTPGGPPPVTGPGSNNKGAPLSVSTAAFREFANSPLEYYFSDGDVEEVTSASGATVALDLVKKGAGYAGTATIRYTANNGKSKEVVFETRAPESWCYNRQIFDYIYKCNPAYDRQDRADYNIWFKDSQGKNVWHGFFQDEYGAIVVVIDGVVDLFDGERGDLVTGSVYFDNFYENYKFDRTIYHVDPWGRLFSTNEGPIYPPTGTPCWEITVGPFDCRAFLKPNGKNYPNASRNYSVDTDSAVYPDNSAIQSKTEARYVKLGTFQGLSLSQSFNE